MVWAIAIIIFMMACLVVALIYRRISARKAIADTPTQLLIAYSDRFRPAIPDEAGHPFRLIPATDSGASRPPIPDDSGHLI